MNELSSVSNKSSATESRADAGRCTSLFLHVIFGFVSTTTLAGAGLEPVLASSGVTVFYLLATFLLRFRGQQPAAVFCGTFAGMTSLFASLGILFSPGLSILIDGCIAVATGILYVSVIHFEFKLPKRLLSGYGGRLGAIAFIGSAICLLTTGLLIRTFSDHLQVTVLKHGALFQEKHLMTMVFVSALGSLLTRTSTKIVNSTAPGVNVVLSASVCGLIGGILFLSLPASGYAASLYWYAGNFAGMSSTSILDSHAKVLLAGAITGIFLAGLHNYGSGAGGLLGFAALLAVIVLKGICRFCSGLNISAKQPPTLYASNFQ